IDMTSPQLSWQQQVRISILHPGSYGALAAQSPGRVVRCMAVLIVILSIIASFHPAHAILTGIDSISAVFAAQAPEFTLRDGELTVDARMPLSFREDDGAVIIIDTTEDADPSVLDDCRRGILLTRYALYEKKYYSLREISYEQFGGFSCDKTSVLRLLPYLRLLVFLVPVWQLLAFATRFFVVGLLLALFALLVASLLKRNAGFGALVRIALYAQLAPSLLVLAFDAGIVNFSYAWWVKIALFTLSACLTTGLAVAYYHPPVPVPAPASESGDTPPVSSQ
ncbi:MAG TPA: DUF1189 family protein, partial [bacterium]|nr:DUF1189 family protein [bacterium]